MAGLSVEGDEDEVTATHTSFLSLVERPVLDPMPADKASTKSAQSHQADTKNATAPSPFDLTHACACVRDTDEMKQANKPNKTQQHKNHAKQTKQSYQPNKQTNRQA